MNYKATISLSVAALCFALLCPQLARARSNANMQPDSSASISSAARLEAARMVPAYANLDQAIDAQKVHPGYKFQAALRGTVQLKNGPELGRGTTLMGTVVTDKMQTDGASRLVLRFEQARLKSGKVIPIKAAIVDLTAPNYEYDSYPGDSGYVKPIAWDRNTVRFDEIGVISGVDLHSNLAGSNSATLVSKKNDDMRLKAGSQMSLAIAAQNAGGMGNGD